MHTQCTNESRKGNHSTHPGRQSWCYWMSFDCFCICLLLGIACMTSHLPRTLESCKLFYIHATSFCQCYFNQILDSREDRLAFSLVLQDSNQSLLHVNGIVTYVLVYVFTVRQWWFFFFSIYVIYLYKESTGLLLVCGCF